MLGNRQSKEHSSKQELTLTLRPHEIGVPVSLRGSETLLEKATAHSVHALDVEQPDGDAAAAFAYPSTSFTKSPFSTTPAMIAPAWHSNSVALDITFLL